MRAKSRVPSCITPNTSEGTPESKTIKLKARIILPELLQKSSLFDLLKRIDVDIAEKIRLKGCPYCNGPLHDAKYARQPRGGPDDIPDEYLIRFSLCCGNCRRRTLPPSCLFMGRRVYWGVVILVVLAFRQNNPDCASARKIQEIFGISRETLKRWIDYYQDVFPHTSKWQRLRSRVISTVSNSELPGGLLKYFIECYKSTEKGVIECLKFLASDNL